MTKGKKTFLQTNLKKINTLWTVLGTLLHTFRVHFIESKKPQPSWDFKMHVIFSLIKNFIVRGAKETVEDAQILVSRVKPKSYKDIAIRTLVIPQEYRERAAKKFEEAYPEILLEHESKAGPLTAEWITFTGKQSDSSKKPVIMLYLHGGAYYLGSADSHRDLVAGLVKRTGGEALVINYRLAPQDAFPYAIHDSLASYLYLLDSCSREGSRIAPENIAVLGDSAGGGLTMASLLAIRKTGLVAPACAVGISPWVDLTHSMNSVQSNRDTDYLPGGGLQNHAMSPLTSDKRWVGRKHYYAPNSSLAHPLVSPLFEADLRGLPPLLIQLGDGELLRDEGILFSLRASGNYQAMNLNEETQNSTPTPVALEIYGEMPHVFHVFSFTTGAKIALDRCAKFVKQVIQEKETPLVPTAQTNYLTENFIDYHGNIKSVKKTEVVGDGKTIIMSY
ncbi:hypothetical protein K7432_013848 [Basidiobolus ranarum]|uniref:Alpha/beta hydrolase fold-3 domain-containing protein n=1 Tax=Basidiobolus ranarum TaxID=34480 RepID=A0ABR2WIJ1_9FUNG